MPRSFRSVKMGDNGAAECAFTTACGAGDEDSVAHFSICGCVRKK